MKTSVFNDGCHGCCSDGWTIAVVRARRLIVAAAVAVAVAACSGPIEVENTPPPDDPEGFERAITGNEYGSVFGDGGIFGNSTGSGSTSGIGVNAFLWRATLDTIAFMPVTVADPFGGVVLTDWRESTESPGERYKMNVYILGRELRADGIRVTVLKQELQDGLWRDRDIAESLSTQIEDAILSRARQFRRESLARE